MSLTLSLSAALLCTALECHPALVGQSTPVGEYTLIRRLTDDPGYGGDVLQFYEDDDKVLAIHRVWTLRPAERREARLKSKNPKDRLITKGCVNVDPEVYELLNDADGQTLRIVP